MLSSFLFKLSFVFIIVTTLLMFYINPFSINDWFPISICNLLSWMDIPNLIRLYQVSIFCTKLAIPAYFAYRDYYIKIKWFSNLVCNLLHVWKFILYLVRACSFESYHVTNYNYAMQLQPRKLFYHLTKYNYSMQVFKVRY